MTKVGQIVGGQVRNTGVAFLFYHSEAYAPAVNQLKMPRLVFSFSSSIR